MIKIDVEKINNWDIIKEKHSEWYKENILPKIEKACKFLESKKNKGSSVEKYLYLLKKLDLRYYSLIKIQVLYYEI